MNIFVFLKEVMLEMILEIIYIFKNEESLKNCKIIYVT